MPLEVDKVAATIDAESVLCQLNKDFWKKGRWHKGNWSSTGNYDNKLGTYLPNFCLAGGVRGMILKQLGGNGKRGEEFLSYVVSNYGIDEPVSHLLDRLQGSVMEFGEKLATPEEKKINNMLKKLTDKEWVRLMKLIGEVEREAMISLATQISETKMDGMPEEDIKLILEEEPDFLFSGVEDEDEAINFIVNFNDGEKGDEKVIQKVTAKACDEVRSKEKEAVKV